jgi:hypothetical protein
VLMCFFVSLPGRSGSLNEALREVVGSCATFDTCLGEMSATIFKHLDSSKPSWKTPLDLEPKVLERLDSDVNSKQRSDDSSHTIFTNPLGHFLKNWSALISDGSLLFDWFR